MDSNNQNNQQEQFLAMQQRLIQLEELIRQTPAQPSAEPFIPPNSNMEEEAEHLSALHSLEIRPSYSWSPSPFLTDILALKTPLFPTIMLPDEERRRIIDKYPNIDQLQYQPPDTIPTAARKMNKYQSKQDMSLKRLQYLVSGVFRPLDVLGLEISQDSSNSNTQRYLLMLKDCRDLILNVSAQINDMRNTLAFQAINPSFTSTNPTGNHNFTMSPADFQAALIQQSTTTQAIKTASGLRNKRRVFNNNNQHQSNSTASTPQFFRSGPSSQQGGYQSGHTNTAPTHKFQNNQQHNYPKPNSNNPYRNKQQQQQ